MNKTKLEKLSAKFEVAFRVLESDKFGVEDKLDQIDVFSDYLYPHEDNDYIDGEINENSAVFLFIDKIISNSENCRDIIIKELEDRHEYELLIQVTTPLSSEVEKTIEDLNIF